MRIAARQREIRQRRLTGVQGARTYGLSRRQHLRHNHVHGLFLQHRHKLLKRVAEAESRQTLGKTVTRA